MAYPPSAARHLSTGEELAAVLERWVSEQEDEEIVPVRPGEPGEETEDRLDGAVIENLRELGDSNLLSELAHMFLEEVPERLDALKEAIEEDDAQTVERIAHTLKGCSGNMGARQMSRLCLDLEEAGESRDLSAAAGILELLSKEFNRVRTELSALVE